MQITDTHRTNPFKAVDSPGLASGAGATNNANSAVRVCRYSDLPRRCPKCWRHFTEQLYRVKFRGKLRKRTILIILLVAVNGVLLLPVWMLPAVAAFMFTIAKTCAKLVRVECYGCGWSHEYLARNCR